MSSAHAQQIESELEFQQFIGTDAQNLTIDQICCAKEDSRWRLTRKARTGYSEPVIWLKLPRLPAGAIVEFPQVADEIILYERAGTEKKWSAKMSGDTVALSKRAMTVTEMALHLSTDQSDSIQRYVRLKQPSQVTHFIDIWFEDRFRESTEQRFNIRLFLLGFCGAMVIFNLVVSLITREKLFAFNAATIGAVIVIAAYTSGQGGYWVWPESPEWSNRSLILALGSVCLFAPLFISTFLQDSTLDKRLLSFNRWTGLFLAAISISTLGSGWIGLHAVMLVSVPVIVISQACLVVASSMRGDRQSFPLLIPFSIMFAGTATPLLRTLFGWDFGWANYHLLEIALALEAITFSLILAARLRLFASKATQAERQLDKSQIEAAQRFSDLQDHERSRMAGDLHDSIGHGLAIAVGHLEMANKSKGLSEELSQRLNHIRLTVKDAISETRRISHALHPARLEHLGLHKGLQSMFDDLARSQNIDCSVNIYCPEELLSKEEKTQISRIVQEAVSNIAKHSRATNCRFLLSHEDESVAVLIEDNGIGNESEKPDDTDGHLGLISIEQRVLRLRGELSIDTSEVGFRIAFSFMPRKLRGL